MNTFQNNGGEAIFGRSFQKKIFLIDQMQYIYPQKSLVTMPFIFCHILNFKQP